MTVRLNPKAFIHAKALVDEGARIGAGTRVWAFAHVVKGAVVGENCNICDHTFIEGKVRIGNRVTLKCGVYLWDGVAVEDGVLIGPGACFTNDLRPRSKQAYECRRTWLREGCSIGANATILPGVTIGAWAMVGAGAVVTRDVPAHGLVYGSPARLQGWVCRCGERLEFSCEGEASCGCGAVFLCQSEFQIEEIICDPRKM